MKKMGKNNVREMKGYPGFRRYLNSQLIDLNYLTNEPAKSRRWFFVVCFSMLVLNSIKMLIQFCQTEVNDLTYYIGDVTIPAGSLKKHLTLIYFAWLIGSTFCAFTLYRSQFQPYLQKWISIGAIFDHLNSSKIHPYTNLPTIFHRYFIFVSKLAFCIGGGGAACIVLPSYFIYPQEYFIYLTIWLIFTVIVGFAIVGSGSNFGPLYAFYLFLFGGEMVLEKKKLEKRIDRNGFASKEKLTKIVTDSCSSSIITLKSMISGYHFWVLYNQSIFMATYSAQFILIYLIFFVDILNLLRVTLIVLTFLNSGAGLSWHFFLGTYAQRKIEQYCKRLRQTLYMDISSHVRLKIILFLEHVEQRYFFNIFGALNYSLYHFVMVILENGASLLLLIASMR